ncbi:MAG: glycosyl hydrolase [Opitutaceae bacterium]|nr:glycosyl hydrolase [Opitutaceae bacterium]
MHLLLRKTILFSFSVLLLSNFACAQETWEERSAKRFKPLSQQDERFITKAQPTEASAQPLKERRILVFYRSEGFIHTSIPWGNFALQKMAEKSRAFAVVLSDDYSVFNADNLKQYDAILFNNSAELKFPKESQRQAIMDFINGGKGVVGIHGATDNFYNWETGVSMMGGQFCGHPWTAEGTWAFKLDDPSHPVNGVFRERGFWHKDEIYQYCPNTYQGEENLRILVSLDMTKEKVSALLTSPKHEKHNKKFGPGPREVPVSWIRSHGNGRLFSTNFGHSEATYTKPVMMKHLLDGIQYALGDLEADDTPSAKIDKPNPALAPNL